MIKDKEDLKHKMLEEDVNHLRKNANNVAIKLEEYQTTYPDFKIQKKLKKQPEPVVVQQNQAK